MQKWTLTLCAGIVLLVLAAILAYPKLTGSQNKISTEFVSMTAETSSRERVQTEKKDDDGPVRVHFGLRVVAEQRQAEIEKATDLLNK
jgi:hypothetical protein